MTNIKRYKTDCRYFSGYKPCSFDPDSKNCDESCGSYTQVQLNILIIHLGALGAVVRSTSLLKGIHQKFPGCKITWITDKPANNLLKFNPLIHQVLTSDFESLLIAKNFYFDVCYVIDKSLKATGILKNLDYDLIYGFKSDELSGSILPATPSANELWELGLSNEKKFHQNQKPETQLIWEALELGPYKREKYFIPLKENEISEAELRHKMWSQSSTRKVIGINTGCSNHIPYKKWTVEYLIKLISKINSENLGQVVLLGGPEDTERNRKIAERVSVLNSPTEQGLRDGIISIEACDIVITGDSLGLHLAIARDKFSIAWFGPTCAHEIDLYDNGVKLLSNLPCSPCWKRSCHQLEMCYDSIPVDDVMLELKIYLQRKIDQTESMQSDTTINFARNLDKT